MNSRRRGVLVLVAFLATLCLIARGWADDDKDEFQPLCDGKSLKGWEFISADANAKLEDTWTVADGVIRCLGKPNGYLRTSDEFRNYVLKLDWRYPDAKDGNSGILLHCQKPDKVWPSSIQVQLHNPEAGSIYALGDSKADNGVMVADKAKPVGEWNTLELTCMDGKITVVLNDEKVGEVTGATPDKGPIALQSEGAEIQFRNVLLKKL